MLASERPGHTLQPTALIHELFSAWVLEIHRIGVGGPTLFAVAAKTLRHILIDYARARSAARRGGNEPKVPVELTGDIGVPCSYDDLLIINEALTELEQTEERGGPRDGTASFSRAWKRAKIARELGVSEITVERDWKFARAGSPRT